MQFGVCTGPAQADIARQAGFGFIECSVGAALKPLEDEAAFAPLRRELEKCALPCLALNCFVPGSHKIVGPEADLAKLESYAQVVFRRAAQVGVRTLVFGSGGARQIPAGFPREQAWEQIKAFCRVFLPYAAAAQVKVVVEPLNLSECNVLNSVGEGARLVQEVAHPNLLLLVDSFHWGRDNDQAADIVTYGKLLQHVHVATVPTRRPPGVEDCAKLAPFFATLRQAGYNGAVSIEAKIENAAAELPLALAKLKALTA